MAFKKVHTCISDDEEKVLESTFNLLVFWLGARWISLQFQGIEKEMWSKEIEKEKGGEKALPKFAACMLQHGATEREREARVRGIADWQGGAWFIIILLIF